MIYRQRYLDRLEAAKTAFQGVSQRQFLRRFYRLLGGCSKDSYLVHQQAIGTAVKKNVVDKKLVKSQKEIGQLLAENPSVISFLCNGRRLNEQKTVVFDALFRKIHSSSTMTPEELFLLAKVRLIVEVGLATAEEILDLDQAKVLSAFIPFHEEWYFEVANSLDQEKHRVLVEKVVRLAEERFGVKRPESLDADMVQRLSGSYADWGPCLFAVDSRLRLYFPWRVLD